MIIFLTVLLGGVGSLLRFIIDGVLRNALRRRFPWATLIINVSGSFLLGLLTAYALKTGIRDAQLVLGVGFCGGFTTFSTASFEAVRLLQEKKYGTALLQIGGNVVLSLVAAFVGLSAL